MAKNTAKAKINPLSFLLIGVGLGVLLTYPVFLPHPLRWGLTFVVLGLIVHLYPSLKK